jgi:hypothetical protein
MATNVNVWFSGWRATGSNVQTPQYEMTIKADWTGNDGLPHTHTELVRFPNILADVPAAWVAKEMQDLLYRALRIKAGLDEPGD